MQPFVPCKWDPVYLFVNRVICRKLYQNLEKDQKIFVQKNSHKHRKVIWLNIIFGIIVYFGLKNIKPQMFSIVITSLMTPAFITGGAWFAISFGGVPKKLIDIAVDITFWMFSAFTISLTTMVITLSFIANWALVSVFSFIISGIFIASILYDNIDGLKAGLDEALLRNNLTNLQFLLEKGYISKVPKGIDDIKRRYPKPFEDEEINPS
jgi:hypothetical protein